MNRVARRVDQAVLVASFLPVLYLVSLPLFDPDLGWHTAGGLWMLDQRTWPARDPFGAQGSVWVCYSWLVELLMGAAFRLGGFPALKILAHLFLVGIATTVVAAERGLRAEAVYPSALARALAGAGCVAAALAFTLPFSHLRPHVLSFVFFALLLRWADRGRLSAARLIPLTVVWANVHVFWPLVALVVFLETALFAGDAPPARRARALAASAGYFALGLINPYGWRAYEVLWTYAFGFEAGNAVISELQPVHPGSIPFLPFVATVGLALAFGRRVLRREKPSLVVLAVLFAVASALRVRYFPLFAFSVLPILSRTVAPALAAALAARFGAGSAAATRSGESPGRLVWREALVVGAAFAVLGAMIVPMSPSLSPKTAALFQIAGRLEGSGLFADSPRVNVLNEHNDGGWLCLAFWQNRPAGWSQNRFKVSMDGRSLVVGDVRGREYTELRQMTGPWRRIFASWRVDVVIAPPAATLLGILVQGSDEELRRLGTWKVFYRDRSVAALVRRPPGEADSR